MDALCDDLVAEHRDLDLILEGADLSTTTPAAGWDIADQISHLWIVDRKAFLALSDPDAFIADAAQFLALVGEGVDPTITPGRSMSHEALIDQWRLQRRELVHIARTVDPRTRVPWYGPTMSARSFVTARLMETWAHGQDIADALGRSRHATDRLRHVAHIGVGARAFSYATNGMVLDNTPIHVHLTGPTGDAWTWGPDSADNTIRGDAADFCLVVTQRRHISDVDLTVVGAAAHRWMSIAQAFAGPPGPGRSPGQFEV